MSDRPTVLINSPDCMPLRAEVRDAFRAGLFLFDGSVPDFHERLLAFLSQPIEAIDVQ